jgi:serine/threonine protein kinase
VCNIEKFVYISAVLTYTHGCISGHLRENPLDSFHPVRVLGQGAFGKVVLAKKKAPDGSEQLFAIKALIQTNLIDDLNRAFIFIEKQVMILASDHPYITTLHSCFRAKVSVNFLNLFHISRESVILKFTVSMKM